MSEEIVKFSKVTKSFGNIKALNNIDFSIEQGNIYGLLGHNGAGKTTIIRLIGGVLEADSGNISVFGKQPIKYGEVVRKNIGVLSDNTGLYESLSAVDNLRYYGLMYKIPKDILDKRIENYLQQFDMLEVKNNPIKEFSSGMKKKIGIIRAIIHEPKLLLLDEASNGLDPVSLNGFHKILEELVKTENIAIVFCSHNLDEVKKICKHVTIIKQGRNIFSSDINSMINKTEHFSIKILILQKVSSFKEKLIIYLNRLNIKDYEFGENSIEINMDSLNGINDVINAVIQCGINIYEVSSEIFDLEKIYCKLDRSTGI